MIGVTPFCRSEQEVNHFCELIGRLLAKPDTVGFLLILVLIL